MRRFFMIGALGVFVLITILPAGCRINHGIRDDYSALPKIVVLIEKTSENLSDSGLVNEKINEYIKPKIGAEVELIFIENILYEKTLRAMYDAGEQTDIVFSISSQVLQNMVRTEKVLPLDTLIDKYGTDIKQQILPNELEAGRIGEQLYGITTNRNKGIVYGFQYRVDIAEKYDIDVSKIKTLADLTPIFRKLKNANPDMYPFVPSNYSRTWDLLSADYYGFGVLMDYGQNLDVVNLYETKQYEDYVRLLYEWNNAGYLLDKTLNYSSERHYYYRSDNIFCWLDTDSPEMVEREKHILGKPIGYVPLSPAFTCTIDFTYAMWSITASCNYPDKAMEFLNLMYSDPILANLLLNGIEGQHYIFIDKAQGVIGFPPGLDSSLSGYYQNDGWKMCNMFITYVWDGNTPDLWEKIREHNEKSLKSKALGFDFNVSNVNSEYSSCIQVFMKYNEGLNAGALDPDIYLPMLREELRMAGIDHIIAEKQRQLNKWIEVGTN